jgi:peroxiredoxin
MIAMVGLSAAAQLPPSKGAPKVGEKAPDFTLPIASGAQKPEEKNLTLSDLVPNKKAQWALLVFYRGYW